MYVVFEFVKLFVRHQDSRQQEWPINSELYKLDAKYIHTCNRIIKVYADTRNGAGLKHLLQIMQYHDSSDSSSSKDEDDMNNLFLSLRYAFELKKVNRNVYIAYNLLQ